jgi:hypothetical protein
MWAQSTTIFRPAKSVYHVHCFQIDVAPGCVIDPRHLPSCSDLPLSWLIEQLDHQLDFIRQLGAPLRRT